MNKSIAIHGIAQDENRWRRRSSSLAAKEGDWIEVRRRRVGREGGRGRTGADEAEFVGVGVEGDDGRRVIRAVGELPQSWKVGGERRAGLKVERAPLRVEGRAEVDEEVTWSGERVAGQRWRCAAQAGWRESAISRGPLKAAYSLTSAYEAHSQARHRRPISQHKQADPCSSSKLLSADGDAPQPEGGSRQASKRGRVMGGGERVELELDPLGSS